MDIRDLVAEIEAKSKAMLDSFEENSLGEVFTVHTPTVQQFSDVAVDIEEVEPVGETDAPFVAVDDEPEPLPDESPAPDDPLPPQDDIPLPDEEIEAPGDAMDAVPDDQPSDEEAPSTADDEALVDDPLVMPADESDFDGFEILSSSLDDALEESDISIETYSIGVEDDLGIAPLSGVRSPRSGTSGQRSVVNVMIKEGWESRLSEMIGRRMSETREIISGYVDDTLAMSVMNLDALGND